LSATPGHTHESAASSADPSAALVAARREIEALRTALAAQVATQQRIQHDLDLRNAALDAATTHFMIVDAQQREQPILYVNRALAAQHGYACPEELLGRSAFTLLGEYVQPEECKRARAELREGRSARLETEVTRPDGTKFLLGFTTTPLCNELGETTHYVTLGADITARRESERRKAELQEQLYAEMRERERMAIELRLAQKLESVGRLAAGLAHEINTPIQYVCDSAYFLRSAFADLTSLFDAYRGSLAMLEQVAGGEQATAQLRELDRQADLEFLLQEVPKAFERTLEGAGRVAAIVRAMKEFAYPDAAEQSPADLNHALTTTLTVARGEYKLAASIVTDFGELPQVVCNIGELNQVFLNLIVNAAHAIHDSGKDATTGVIEIATRADGELAQVVISDNGCGITAENLEKIFDPFFTTKEVGRGTGQGLAIARAIVVEKHGGRIDVTSTPGVGTRFNVLLPIQGCKAKEAA
jgi:two-component system, NtrC family, sensor kinase